MACYCLICIVTNVIVENISRLTVEHATGTPREGGGHRGDGGRRFDRYITFFNILVLCFLSILKLQHLKLCFLKTNKNLATSL